MGSVTAKFCSGCEETKSLDQFHRNTSKRDGHQTRCKECCKSPAIREGRARYRATPEARRIKRDYHLLKKYGLSPGDWDGLLVFQSGRCASCADPLVSRIHVDHDHATGAVRSLLCHGCNLAEGLLQSDPARALALYRYMIAWAA